MSSKFYYKSGQWSADFITVVRVRKPSICPTDYTFCFSYRFLFTAIIVPQETVWKAKHVSPNSRPTCSNSCRSFRASSGQFEWATFCHHVVQEEHFGKQPNTPRKLLKVKSRIQSVVSNCHLELYQYVFSQGQFSKWEFNLVISWVEHECKRLFNIFVDTQCHSGERGTVFQDPNISSKMFWSQMKP